MIRCTFCDDVSVCVMVRCSFCIDVCVDDAFVMILFDVCADDAFVMILFVMMSVSVMITCPFCDGVCTVVMFTFSDDICVYVVVRTCELSGKSLAPVSMVWKMSSVLLRIPWQPSPCLQTHRLSLLNN